MKLYQYEGRCNLAGERIRQRRQSLRLSQEQLAARLQLRGLELGQKAVSRMETGSRVIPDYELLWLAQALETTTAWLLGRSPKHKNPVSQCGRQGFCLLWGS